MSALEICAAETGDVATLVSLVGAHLEDLFVVVSARGRDVGRRLLRHTLARAKARGARRFRDDGGG